MSEDITLGELGRRIATLESRVNGGFGEVNRRLDTLQYVPREVFAAEMRAIVAEIQVVKDDVKDIKDRSKMLTQAIIGSLLFPIIVAIVIALVITL